MEELLRTQIRILREIFKLLEKIESKQPAD